MIFELTITNRMVAAGIDALCGFMGCERYQGDGRLIRTVPHPDDARRRVAKLTAAGRREFQAYETLSIPGPKRSSGAIPIPKRFWLRWMS